ncbi:Outer membrane protein YopM [Candida viswanathii]|uniref:Outer membrane protein YopM n=1 Tax=Candida viswanathii TaxID=5486 RepID=A0A367YE60_9ASCO|nr:Outer membrane protein YopM [Candida viswanathii]
MDTDEDFVDSFLVNNFPNLPDDIILQIIKHLSLDYIIEWILHVPQLQDIVIQEFYNANEIQFLVSPTKRPHLNHVPRDKLELTTFKGYYQICTFITENASKIVPKKLLIICGGDWLSLVSLLSDFRPWLSKIKSLELVLETYTLKPKDLQTILEFGNLSKIHFGGVSLKNCSRFLRHNELLSHHPSLSNIILLRHEITNWSEIDLPQGLKSLDLSWDSTINIKTLRIPGDVEEIYFNSAKVEDVTNIDLHDCGDSLTTLMLTYNSITLFNLKELPPQLKTLDLSCNLISEIKDVEYGWPDLVNLLLRDNRLVDYSLSEVTQWPPNLKMLALTSNELENVSYLSNLPDSIEVLDLSNNEFRSLIVPSTGESFKFPKNLKNLQLAGCKFLIPDDDSSLSNHLEFPHQLEELNLSECNITTLNAFKFPTSLVKLALSGNKIVDLGTYDDHISKSWLMLNNLRELDLYSNDIRNLEDWQVPAQLKYLDVRVNYIEKLSSAWPIFNKEYNQDLQLSHLNVSYCRLEEISNDLELPVNLRVLDISNNAISGTFKFLPCFKQLFFFNLSMNLIRDIEVVDDPNRCNIFELNLTENYICHTNRNKESIQEFYSKLESGMHITIKNKKFKVNSIHTLR